MSDNQGATITMPKKSGYEIVHGHDSNSSFDGIELDLNGYVKESVSRFKPISKWLCLAAGGLVLVVGWHFWGSTASSSLPSIPAGQSCPELFWSDEFQAPELNLTKWTFQNGNGCDVGLCGWGNNELEFYSPENLYIQNDTLIIEARYDPNTENYTSSKILSKNKADFGPFGRLEARIKLPQGQGIWPAFWMLPTDNVFGGWPKSGEIDIMENIGKEGANTVHGTIHYGPDWPNDQYAEAGITLDPTVHGDMARTFHVFSVERERGAMRFFVDNILYSTRKATEFLPYEWPFDNDFYFILNLAIGGNWPGMPDDTTTFPQQLQVDYVRVFERHFPRIDGMAIVDSNAKNATYRIVNAGGWEDASGFRWTVPNHATIQSGQGTREVQVTFGPQGGLVLAERIDDEEASQCEHVPKKAGLQVKVMDPSKYTDYNFDCGHPDSCTPYVLNQGVDEHTCGDRIKWLMETQGKTEMQACGRVASESSGICGGCYPGKA